MASSASADHRRHPRIPLQGGQPLQVELDGRPHSLIVSDISEGGIGFVDPQGTVVNTNGVMAIGIEQVVNLRGRVRWVQSAPGKAKSTRLGVEFESISVQPKAGEEIQEMVDAWMKISHSYNVFDGFLHILDLIDSDILDGQIAEFSDAVNGITLWISQQLGPVNLWQVILSPAGHAEPHLLVDQAASDPEVRRDRAARVAAVAEKRVSDWFEGRPYIYGDGLVIECLEAFEGQTDLLHKLANLLGKRLHIWTKLLSKNIALQLLAEEVERYRSPAER